MIDIKSMDELVQNIINTIHDTMPEVDIKEGTFVRDTFIDPNANEMATLYNTLLAVQTAQSILTATGDDLDTLASNYFIERKPATCSYGTIRAYIKNTDIDDSNYTFSDFIIPEGTIFSTKDSLSMEAITIETTEDIVIYGNTVPYLPKDDSVGFRYIDIECKSSDIGEATNIPADSISSYDNQVSDYIILAKNLYSFSGGSDEESDLSLILRISLAITGSNIGTKDGYLSYVLKQDNVFDARIICAGDDMMKRDLDIDFNNPDNTEGFTGMHLGGMVDIYTRMEELEDAEYDKKLNDSDFTNAKLNDIILPNCPVNSIDSIIGEIELPTDIGKNIIQKTYINADDYDIEIRRTSDGNYNNAYYEDILWDFNIKDSFPDAQYFPLPLNLTSQYIANLKTQVDTQLNLVFDLMHDYSYNMDCGNIYWNNTDIPDVTLFEFGYLGDGKIYMLRMKQVDDGKRLGDRIFVKKNDNIYVRYYTNPDFKLEKDISDATGYSYKAQDKIIWLDCSRNIPQLYEKLIIKYKWKKVLKDLQDKIEKNKCLTADVLIRDAQEMQLEISLTLKLFPEYDKDDITTQVHDAIIDFVENIKRMGGYFDKSDIVVQAGSIEGVDSIDLNSIVISELHGSAQSKIIANDNQYFKIKNININIEE